MNTTKQQELREAFLKSHSELYGIPSYLLANQIADYWLKVLHSEQIALLKELRGECEATKRVHEEIAERADTKFQQTGEREWEDMVVRNLAKVDALSLLTASISTRLNEMGK